MAKKREAHEIIDDAVKAINERIDPLLRDREGKATVSTAQFVYAGRDEFPPVLNDYPFPESINDAHGCIVRGLRVGGRYIFGAALYKKGDAKSLEEAVTKACEELVRRARTERLPRTEKEMGMTVRMIFKCVEKTVREDGGGTLRLSATYTDTKGNRINEEFAAATPYAELTATIDNPAAMKSFELNEFYEGDFRLYRGEMPKKEG